MGLFKITRIDYEDEEKVVVETINGIHQVTVRMDWLVLETNFGQRQALKSASVYEWETSPDVVVVYESD